MNAISIAEREMTEAELARTTAGFDEHTIEHGNPVQVRERYGFVAMDGDAFVGCATGLAYKNCETYGDWFYLTDLYIEKPYRRLGLGSAILRDLESRVARLG